MGISRIFGKGIKKSIRFIIDLVVYYLPVYHTKLDRISIKKWFEIIEGNKKSLYRFSFISHIPSFFDNIILKMLYSLEHMNTEIIEKEAELSVLRSIAVRTKSKPMQFQADVLENELKLKKQSYKNSKGLSLNAFIDYIELTFDSIGKINPEKISASRAFSLYHKACEKNQRLADLNKRHSA